MTVTRTHAVLIARKELAAVVDAIAACRAEFESRAAWIDAELVAEGRLRLDTLAGVAAMTQLNVP